MDFANILSVTHSHIANGKPVMDAARGAFDVAKKDRPTLIKLFTDMAAEEKVRKATDSAGMTTAAQMRCILEADGVDLTDRKAMSAALWPHAAEAAGLVYVKGSKKAARSKEDATLYQNVGARVSRAIRRILGTDPVSMRAKREAGLTVAPSKAKVRVGSDALAVATARAAAGKSKADAKAELLAALDRAYA